MIISRINNKGGYIMKKKNNNKESLINCDVSNCLYNNSEEGMCLLNNINISSIGKGSECTDTSSTICESFENSGGIITDNVYEVSSEFIPDEDLYINKKEDALTII